MHQKEQNTWDWSHGERAGKIRGGEMLRAEIKEGLRALVLTRLTV